MFVPLNDVYTFINSSDWYGDLDTNQQAVLRAQAIDALKQRLRNPGKGDQTTNQKVDDLFLQSIAEDKELSKDIRLLFKKMALDVENDPQLNGVYVEESDQYQRSPDHQYTRQFLIGSGIVQPGAPLEVPLYERQLNPKEPVKDSIGRPRKKIYKTQ